MIAAVLPEGVRAGGMILAALLAAGAFLAPTARARALAMLAALALTPLLLGAEIWDTPQVESLRDRPAFAVAALAAGLVMVAALAVVLARRPLLLAPLAVAALPFRIPIEAGGSTANLLVPLYVVIGAGALAWAVPRLRGEPAQAPRENALLERLLGAALVLYALQAAYSSDVAKALEQVVFFYVPFALLFGLLRELDWTRELAFRCLLVLGALALVFVGVGFWEYAERRLLFNPKVIVSNQFESYFRVNSLFFDPNIYGRFLAMVMIGVAAALLWLRRTRDVWLAAVALALLWGGLVLTFSQSSFAALLVGLAVLAALRWRAVKLTAFAAAGVLALGALFVVVAPSSIRLDLSSSESIDDATSGRSDLIRGGVELWSSRPVLGYGSGAFEREYRRQEKTSSQRATSASHTIPITIAAEQGVLGLAVYLALLAAALARLLRGSLGAPARAAVAAGFVALIAHTLLYAAFLEDPLAWTLLAIGTALAAGPRPGRAAGEENGPVDAADALASLRAAPAAAAPST